MSFVRRYAVPFAAGLAAATAAFAVVALTTDDGGGQRPGSGVSPGPAPAASAPSDGLAVFTRMGCGGCHTLAAAGSSGPVAPNLDGELPDHTRESLTAAIVRPPPASMMPQDFGERMSDAELAALVDFLLAAR
jgi:mono/diheme cytochrome c family protein